MGFSFRFVSLCLGRCVDFFFGRRLGLEGLVTFQKETHTFDPDQYSITLPSTANASCTIDGRPSKPSKSDRTLRVFDKVAVNITVEKDKNTQRGKVHMALVWPVESSVL